MPLIPPYALLLYLPLGPARHPPKARARFGNATIADHANIRNPSDLDCDIDSVPHRLVTEAVVRAAPAYVAHSLLLAHHAAALAIRVGCPAGVALPLCGD